MPNVRRNKLGSTRSARSYLLLIMDIARRRSFRPVSTSKEDDIPGHFFKVDFVNKGLDAIKFSNILHQKTVQSNIPPYFIDKSTPLISYTHTVASRIFNYKTVLQHISIDDMEFKPPDCSCSSSPFNYRRWAR